MDAAREASRTTTCGVAVVVAASRIRHPLDARTLARLAARYAGRRARRGRRLRPLERRAARRHAGVREGLLASPNAPAWPPSRTAGSCSGRPPSGRRWTPCTPTGSATASGPRRTLRCSSASSAPASASRSARRATWRWGSIPRPRTSRCAAWSTPAPSWRSAPTTRCCSALGSPPSTNRPRRPRIQDGDSRPWPARPSRCRGRRERSASGSSRASTTGSPISSRCPARADPRPRAASRRGPSRSRCAWACPPASGAPAREPEPPLGSRVRRGRVVVPAVVPVVRRAVVRAAGRGADLPRRGRHGRQVGDGGHHRVQLVTLAGDAHRRPLQQRDQALGVVHGHGHGRVPEQAGRQRRRDRLPERGRTPRGATTSRR